MIARISAQATITGLTAIGPDTAKLSLERVTVGSLRCFGKFWRPFIQSGVPESDPCRVVVILEEPGQDRCVVAGRIDFEVVLHPATRLELVDRGFAIVADIEREATLAKLIRQNQVVRNRLPNGRWRISNGCTLQ